VCVGLSTINSYQMRGTLKVTTMYKALDTYKWKKILDNNGWYLIVKMDTKTALKKTFVPWANVAVKDRDVDQEDNSL
jgi:hypothetical protein